MRLAIDEKPGPEIAHLTPDSSHEDCIKAAEALYAELASRRAKAESHPLQFEDELTFSGPSLRKYYDSTAQPKGDTAKFEARPRLSLDETRTHTLKLLAPLNTGKLKWSQTWICELSATGLGPVQVVLKLYQEAFFPLPEEYHFANWISEFGTCWQRAGYFARREANAYYHLSPEQGRLVPHCYGFYKFALPSGEIVEGVVLERIKGKTVRQYFLTINSGNPIEMEHYPHLEKLLQAVAHGCLRLHSYGIAQGDGNEGNVLVTGESGNNLQVLLLDFGLSIGGDIVMPRPNPYIWAETFGGPITGCTDLVKRELLRHWDEQEASNQLAWAATKPPSS